MKNLVLNLLPNGGGTGPNGPNESMGGGLKRGSGGIMGGWPLGGRIIIGGGGPYDFGGGTGESRMGDGRKDPWLWDLEKMQNYRLQ